ncbi:MAG: DUF1961 family protein [Puniceicoccaceae bacterium]|nr:MAG: DUF1961 family protein [Puniceicoccaceae bacterium]
MGPIPAPPVASFAYLNVVNPWILLGVAVAVFTDLSAMPSSFAPPPPHPGLSVHHAAEPASHRIGLDPPLGEVGAISFWLLLDRPYRAGPGVTALDRELVSLPGLFRLRFTHAPEQISLIWRWEGLEDRGDTTLNVQLPGLPGPGWVHFAAAWNAADGRFDVFLNGSPLRTPGTRIAPWQPGAAREAVFPLGHFAIADPRLSASALAADAIRELVGPLYRGSLDHVLGLRERGAFDPAPLRGDLIEANPLSEASTADWVLEGPGRIAFADGWMRMASERPDGSDGHLVFWRPEDLPDRFVAEWEMQLLEETGLCIVFFGARGRDGRDLFDPSLAPRDGRFLQYTEGDIDCYHISYYPNSPVMEPGRITSNLRKNSGFFLVDNGPEGIPIGSRSVHRITLVKDGPHLRLAVDDRLVIDFTDDGERFGPRLTEGKLGFRQMQWTVARYRNLRIHHLR